MTQGLAGVDAVAPVGAGDLVAEDVSGRPSPSNRHRAIRARVVSPGWSSGPARALDVLSDAGVDVVSMANNDGPVTRATP